MSFFLPCCCGTEQSDPPSESDPPSDPSESQSSVPSESYSTPSQSDPQVCGACEAVPDGWKITWDGMPGCPCFEASGEWVLSFTSSTYEDVYCRNVFWETGKCVWESDTKAIVATYDGDDPDTGDPTYLCSLHATMRRWYMELFDTGSGASRTQHWRIIMLGFVDGFQVSLIYEYTVLAPVSPFVPLGINCLISGTMDFLEPCVDPFGSWHCAGALFPETVTIEPYVPP